MTTLEEEWGAAGGIPQLEQPGVPWEDQKLSGWVGFYRTLRDLLFYPSDFFENLNPVAGWAEPLAFALIVSTGGLLSALFWHFLVLAGGIAGNAAGPAPLLNITAGVLLGLMAASPLLVLFDLVVGSLCWWGSLALLGASRNFIPAWRIFCYAQGGLILAVIPFLGLPVAGIWILILMYQGAKKVFGFSTLGSVGALVIFLISQTVLGMILLFGFVLSFLSLGFLALLG